MAIDEKKFLADQKWKADLLINANKDTKVAGNPISSPFSEDWRFDDGYDDIESYRGQPVFGVEEDGQTFFEFPFVKIRGNNQKVASTPQQHRQYPSTLYYNIPKELDGVSPIIINQFMQDKAKEIFKLNTGIPLAQNKDTDFQDTWKHMDAERKTEFLKRFREWQLENNINIEDQPDSKTQTNSLKIGTA